MLTEQARFGRGSSPQASRAGSAKVEETVMLLEIGLSLVILLLLAVVIVLRHPCARRPALDRAGLDARFEAVDEAQARFERLLREEMVKNREERSTASRSDREELGRAVNSLGDSVAKRIGEMASLQKSQLDIFSTRLETLTETNDSKLETVRSTVDAHLGALQGSMTDRHKEMRDEASANRKAHREEISLSLKNLSDSVLKRLATRPNGAPEGRTGSGDRRTEESLRPQTS